MDICKHPGVNAVLLTLSRTLWPMFRFDRSDTVYLVGLSEKCRGGQRPKPGSETYLEKDGRQKLQGMNKQKQEI